MHFTPPPRTTLHLFVPQQVLGLIFPKDPADLEEITAIGVFQSRARVLFYQQYRCAIPVYPLDLLEDEIDVIGGEGERGLIEQE
jgi:hypothetical protein